MSEKKSVRQILLAVLAAILAFIIIVAAAGFCYYRFYIMPKYNEAVQQSGDDRKELTNEDIFSFAKLFSNPHFLENLKNFDKESAPEVLNILEELEQENPAPESSPQAGENSVPDSPAVSSGKNTHISDQQLHETTDKVGKTAESVNKKSAYDRIMAAADKDEIMEGMAIISKVDMSTVNKLRSEGNSAGLKAYIKSVLTSSEISASLRLYNKYKHLL